MAPDLLRQTFTVQGMTADSGLRRQHRLEDLSLRGPQGSRTHGRGRTPRPRGGRRFLRSPGRLPGRRATRSSTSATTPSMATTSHRLKVTLKNGDIYYYYLDPETFLEVRMESVQFIRGAVQESVIECGSYKLVAGVYFRSRSKPAASRIPANRSKITFDKIEANVPLDPRRVQDARRRAARSSDMTRSPSHAACSLVPALFAPGARPLRCRHHLRPARAQYRLRADERPDRRRRRRQRERTAHRLRRSASGGVWKSVNGGTTFKPVFDNPAVAVHRRHRHRPHESQKRLGGHRRELGAQQRLHRRRHLQVHRRRRELDQRRPARIPSASPRSWSIPRTATPSTPAPPGTSGTTATSAASTRPPTAARPGARCWPAPTRSTGCGMLA